MVNQENLLDTLVYLLSDASPFTRRYASAALFTLACTYANTAVMARHCDGGILEALRKVLLNDPVDEARINAAEALFNMARNNSDDTVENMGNHPKLLASLAHSVLTDYSADVRAYAARALEWLSADIHYPMQCHPRLLQALTTASQWTKTTCIAEALKMQASLVENRRSMVEHPGLLDALAQLSLLDGINDDEVKMCAIAALERLSKEPSTRHLMAGNEGVMTALTRATFEDDGYNDVEDVQNATLMKMALKNLAEHL
jgi:HEAT repeat protein